MAAYRVGHAYRFVRRWVWLDPDSPGECQKGDVILIVKKSPDAFISENTFLYKEKVYTCTLPIANLEWVEYEKK